MNFRILFLVSLVLYGLSVVYLLFSRKSEVSNMDKVLSDLSNKVDHCIQVAQSGSSVRQPEKASCDIANVVYPVDASIVHNSQEYKVEMKEYKYKLQLCQKDSKRVVDSGGWCIMPDRNGVYQKHYKLARALPEYALEKLFSKNDYVADIGGGEGHYLQYMNKVAKRPMGQTYDGGIGVIEATEGRVRYLNMIHRHLVSPYFPIFDWIWCLEMGEHIDKAYEHNVFDTLALHAKKGVILSWAIPKQGGVGHVNERENNYIINEMIKRGFQYDSKSSTEMRELDMTAKHVQNSFDDGGSNLKANWFKKTLMVFRKN